MLTVPQIPKTSGTRKHACSRCSSNFSFSRARPPPRVASAEIRTSRTLGIQSLFARCATMRGGRSRSCVRASGWGLSASQRFALSRVRRMGSWIGWMGDLRAGTLVLGFCFWIEGQRCRWPAYIISVDTTILIHKMVPRSCHRLAPPCCHNTPTLYCVFAASLIS